MNPHTLAENVRSYLSSAQTELPVYAAVGTAELHAPYVLLTCVAEKELIPGNHTWEYTLEMSLISCACDESDEEMHRSFGTLCTLLESPQALPSINTNATDMLLYHLTLHSTAEPQAQDTLFTQSATFRIVVQF